MFARRPDFVPAHVRHFAPRRIGKPFYPSGQDAQTGAIAFFAVFKQHLLADANAQKRLIDRRFPHRLIQPASGQFAHTVVHRALTGENHPRSRSDFFRPARNLHAATGGRNTFQRLVDRMQVAHAVIDNGDIHAGSAHNTPFVDGTLSARAASTATAMRSARANALNRLSH